jgi:putative flippase GtrA
VKQFLSQKRQFILYCVIGASGAALDFGTFSLLVRTTLLNYQAANAIGYASGTLLSFILNARYNFRVTDRMAARMASFFGVAFLGWAASAILLNVLIGHYGFDKYLSKFATMVVVVLLQYNLNRLFSFRKAT